jgi:hypothetical protein
MHASLEAIVELTLASTTSKDLSFYYKLVLTLEQNIKTTESQ